MDVNLHEFEELKQEVKNFLAESEETRTPRPILRIGELITAMRRYKAEIISANAPCGFCPDADTNSFEREILRQHRLDKVDKDDGVQSQKKRLLGLNSEWIVNGEPWRVQDAIWQIKIWTPLDLWVKRGFDLMYQGIEEACWPKLSSLPTLSAWEQEEQEIEFQLFLRINDFLPEGEWPLIDFERGTLTWAGRSVELTDRELKIIDLLVKHKGKYVRKTALFQAAGDSLMGEDAFRKMFSRLKTKLTQSGFSDIALSIVQASGGRLRLDHDKLLESLIATSPKDVT